MLSTNWVEENVVKNHQITRCLRNPPFRPKSNLLWTSDVEFRCGYLESDTIVSLFKTQNPLAKNTRFLKNQEYLPYPPGFELPMEDLVTSGLGLPRIPPPPRIGTSHGGISDFGSAAAKNYPPPKTSKPGCSALVCGDKSLYPPRMPSSWILLGRGKAKDTPVRLMRMPESKSWGPICINTHTCWSISWSLSTPTIPKQNYLSKIIELISSYETLPKLFVILLPYSV